MTLGNILKDALQVFGFPDAASAPQKAIDRALNDINATIQQLADAGEDFFGREELEVDLVTEIGSYTLPKNVQTVLKPVKLDDGTILRELTSRGQFLQFGQIFADQLSNAVAPGKPSAYFVESQRDTDDVSGDNVETIIHVLPSPTAGWAAEVSLLLDVIREPSPVTAVALSAGTAVLEIPHKYVESIFLPLLRHNLSGSYLFQDKDKKPQIDLDYNMALVRLGKSDPRNTPKENPEPAAEAAQAR